MFNVIVIVLMCPFLIGASLDKSDGGEYVQKAAFSLFRSLTRAFARSFARSFRSLAQFVRSLARSLFLLFAAAFWQQWLYGKLLPVPMSSYFPNRDYTELTNAHTNATLPYTC